MAQATPPGPDNTKTVAATTGVTEKAPVGTSATPTVMKVEKTSTDDAATEEANRSRSEAKSHFNTAISEAKAGASALKAEATTRATTYREQARTRRDEYSTQARTRASEYAVEGKAKASGAISSLSRMVSDNAQTLDDNLGQRYGDYARDASRSLQQTADKLDAKSVEELQEDARTMIRRSPGTAVGVAALAGFLVARALRFGR